MLSNTQVKIVIFSRMKFIIGNHSHVMPEVTPRRMCLWHHRSSRCSSAARQVPVGEGSARIRRHRDASGGKVESRRPPRSGAEIQVRNTYYLLPLRSCVCLFPPMRDPALWSGEESGFPPTAPCGRWNDSKEKLQSANILPNKMGKDKQNSGLISINIARTGLNSGPKIINITDKRRAKPG